MKTILLLFLALCSAAVAEPITKVERGLNLVKTWKNGSFLSEFRQVLNSFTNLLQTERYCQPDTGSWTQKLSVARYCGSSSMPLIEGYSVEWKDGIACTNILDPDSGAWSIFHSGGNQGAMVTVNGDERTQIINCSVLHCEWRTNGWSGGCQFGDDNCTMILWFRTNTVASGLPWFIGNYASLEPGTAKDVKIDTPTDCIWHFMGTDKCFACGEPCWLAGWPDKPAHNGNSFSTVSGGFLHVSFTGAIGATYALKQSPDLRGWVTIGTSVADSQGGLNLDIPISADHSYFRFEAVRTSTMNERETEEAINEIRQFNGL